MLLAQKVALITGAGSGIGRAAAVRFAAEGARVVVVDWKPDGGRDTVARIRAEGGEAIFVEADVSQEERRAADDRGRRRRLRTLGHPVEQRGGAGVRHDPRNVHAAIGIGCWT